ncbi:MAG: transcriptional repressor [Pseudomonadales bacterium]|nr:transcriptional repressor [Pseudomonadales bacterium]
MQIVPPVDRARLAESLAARGVRPTAQRLKIASLLLATPQHMTAEQIIATLKQAGTRVSKATVYNTLNLLAAHGFVRQVSSGDERALFDSNTHPHYHFHDLDGGSWSDVEESQVSFSRFPEPPPGFAVVGVDLTIRLRRLANK